MSRDFANTNSDFLSRAGAVVTAAPFSAGIWFNTDAASAVDHLITFGISGSANNQFRLLTENTGKIRMQVVDNTGTTTTATTPTLHSTGVWESAVMAIGPIAGSVYPMAVWLNGGGKSSPNTSLVPTGINYTRISGNADAGGQHFDGRLAMLAIWNALLTDAEVTQFATGIAPIKIRSSALVGLYPYIGRDSSDIDVIGGNSLTVTGTTVSAAQPPVLWIPGNRKIFLATMVGGAAPAFTAGPVQSGFTGTTSTFSYTSSADATLYVIGVYRGDTAPTAAQVIAAVDYSGGTVVAFASEACVAGVADTVHLTGLTDPIHDFYAVLDNADGTSSVAAITAVLLGAGAGKVYKLLTEPGGGWSDQSFPYGASPAVVTGDVLHGPVNTDAPGNLPISYSSDGIMSYTGGADQRQHVSVRIWDVSARVWSPFTDFWVNNHVPTVDSAPIIVGAAVAFSLDMRPRASDVDGDAVTVTTSDTLPGTATLVASILAGTVNTPGDYPIDWLYTDIIGDSILVPINIHVGGVTVPDVTNAPTYDVAEATAVEQLVNSGLTPAVAYEYTTFAASGFVFDQNPAPAAVVSPLSTVTITVSLGTAPADTTTHFSYGVPRRFGSA